MMANTEKIQKYERFLDDTLKRDLKEELERRDKLFQDIADHSQLKQTIDCILQAPSDEALRTQVDLGSNFYVQAQVPDVSHIYVNVGLGIHVELTLEEALHFINKRMKILNEKVECSTKKSAKIKGDIKYVCELLRQLQGMVKKMAVAVKKVPVNILKIWLLSLIGGLILWATPLILGKYTDVTFPFIASDDITYELVGLVGRPKEGMQWCPPISPYLENTIRLLDSDINLMPVEEIAHKFRIKVGGSWMPLECQSRYQVAVIIPYRNRSQHLQQFLTYMHPFLIRQQLDYRIVIVEQSDTVPFNRAKLFNIGFIETLKIAQIDCFIFHDVDLLPQNDFNIYACTHHPRHMYSAVDTFRYHLPYRHLLGGAIAVQRIHFSAVNGFANQFYGWGGEDDDFYSRIESKGLTIIRFDPRVASYVMLSHQSLPPSDDRFLHMNEGMTKKENDGLSNLSYQVLKKKLMPLYTWFMVSC